jgi:hypothetical protein
MRQSGEAAASMQVHSGEPLLVIPSAVEESLIFNREKIARNVSTSLDMTK